MSIFEYFSYGEIIRFIICVFLDGVEFIVPALLTPIVGDLLDVVGFFTCLYLFEWIGLVSALEFIPSFDILPINFLTWIIWILIRRWEYFQDMLQSYGFRF